MRWQGLPVVFQMRKVRPDRLNPCFSNLTVPHNHLWAFCKVLFAVPGGGEQSLFFKSSQGDPEVQSDLGTQGLSDLPRVFRKEGNTPRPQLNFLNLSTHLFIEHLLCNKDSAKYWKYNREKTIIIPLVS